MFVYEVAILAGMTQRVIRVEAETEADAYALAEKQCESGEFVRGVNPTPVAWASWSYMTDEQDREQYGSGPEGLA